MRKHDFVRIEATSIACKPSLGNQASHAGRKANPLEDLPRWRVESLVGTFVLDMSLYRRALTAPSAVPDSITASYERLEYLGDGILEGIIRQFIYSRCVNFRDYYNCCMHACWSITRRLHARA